ncbi:hypothetical protein G1ANC_00252 [Candidatus Nanosynsacchari sp. TM7_ANC_38.39_G1_1]|nr:hypothetical protein G1ANC_00252 [Candidatus Nanosynsacchari sp. TM7_ANC_38.39_G1_1]
MAQGDDVPGPARHPQAHVAGEVLAEVEDLAARGGGDDLDGGDLADDGRHLHGGGLQGGLGQGQGLDGPLSDTPVSLGLLGLKFKQAADSSGLLSASDENLVKVLVLLSSGIGRVGAAKDVSSDARHDGEREGGENDDNDGSSSGAHDSS